MEGRQFVARFSLGAPAQREHPLARKIHPIEKSESLGEGLMERGSGGRE
jgi:hypothetical protein